jgi:D-alanyl-D-alanine carboxypeptidase/D-alanyl-D-alanine-endopeptidase (penicillin-binding protein 4)
VLKAMTTAYALGALGPDYRFRTRVLATGPVVDGMVRGDLVLAGDGDPSLDTNALKALAAAVASRGVAGVAGRLLVAEGALPAVEAVDVEQPMHVGYNPAISGLNLNFNRASLEWAPSKAGPPLSMLAPGARFSVDAGTVSAAVGGKGLPQHSWAEGREIWTLPGASLRGKGSVWLPVRGPGAYAGAVFRALAGEAGVALPEARVVEAAPAGAVLAASQSPALVPVLTEMLRYSTNLTAEVAGLSASAAGGVVPGSLSESAAAMSSWARARYRLEAARFVNHSGLTERSLLPPSEMVRLLCAETGRLPDMLREKPVLDAQRRAIEMPGLRMRSKTGTLNFTTARAGYLEVRGRQLAFAIFAADLARRAAVPPELRDAPPGGDVWLARARGQEQALLRRWVALYL